MGQVLNPSGDFFMQTLYRKYRPQNFDEVFGQESIVKVLRHQIKEGRLGHAYLFAGPRGTGKTSMARLVAKSLNCKKLKKDNPCKKCEYCLAIQNGRFLDLVEIDAASNRGIDEIRKLRERVNFSPSEGKSKIYIIDEVHMLTKDAFNALLKTLEEPPAHVIFILATTEPHKVLPTILSRCQRFNFTLATEEQIVDFLKYICKKEKVKFTDEALLAIAKVANGSFRDSASILEKVLGGIGVIKDKKVDFADVKDILGLAEEIEIKKFVDSLLQKDGKASLKVFEDVVAGGVNIFQFIRGVLEYIRSLLLKKITLSKGEYRLSDLLTIITELSQAESQLKFASIERLPVEVAIVKICSKQEDAHILTKEAQSEKEEKNLSKKVGDVITKIPQKIKDSIKSRAASESSIDYEDISASWGKIIEEIIPYNHHLSAFFRRAKPIKIEGGKLLLHVPYNFHKKRIESSKGKEIFSEVTKKVLGASISCACKVVEIESQQEEAGNILAGNDGVVLEILGDI